MTKQQLKTKKNRIRVVKLQRKARRVKIQQIINLKKKQQAKGKKQKGNHSKSYKEAPASTKAAKPETPKHIVYSGTLTVEKLAEKLNKDVSEIIKKLLFLGIMATKNQDLEDDAVELI